MPGVLVFGESSREGLHEGALEALTAGASLATQLGEPLVAALLGADAPAAVKAFQRGPGRMLVFAGEGLRQYDGERFAAHAQAALAGSRARIALAPHTVQARDWMPRLAARMVAGLAMDCTAIAADGDALVATRPIFGGGVVGDFVLRGTPVMATLRPGAFEPASTVAACTVEVIEPPAVPDSGVTLIEEIAGDTGGGLRLQDAKIVVSGGRGVGGFENWHYIEEAAHGLGAAIGCSRPVVDAKWLDKSRQVGSSGQTVRPRVYLACGISGSFQHLAGIQGNPFIVAINKNPKAPIFRAAHVGIVDDLLEFLPALADRVREETSVPGTGRRRP